MRGVVRTVETVAVLLGGDVRLEQGDAHPAVLREGEDLAYAVVGHPGERRRGGIRDVAEHDEGRVGAETRDAVEFARRHRQGCLVVEAQRDAEVALDVADRTGESTSPTIVAVAHLDRERVRSQRRQPPRESGAREGETGGEGPVEQGQRRVIVLRQRAADGVPHVQVEIGGRVRARRRGCTGGAARGRGRGLLRGAAGDHARRGGAARPQGHDPQTAQEQTASRDLHGDPLPMRCRVMRGVDVDRWRAFAPAVPG